MNDTPELMEALDARVRRRETRRDFFRAAAGGVAVAAVGATALSWSEVAAAQTVTDADILNFALNLEYLEAQFYSYASSGVGLSTSLLGGTTGTPGSVSGGRQVAFSDPIVAQYAREIAADEVAHVTFLRTTLGASAVAQPAIDISVSATSAFSNAARAAGLITAATDVFDPYASDENFLLGAFIFEDVGVTAYKGAAPLISSNAYLDAAAGILAAEAFHAGIIRSALYRKGVATPTLRTQAGGISNARDVLDGGTEIDQGIAATTKSGFAADGTTAVTYTLANITPTDANGIAYSRATGQVLNIVYLTGTAASAGGFFPAGLNGSIKTSTAAA